MSTDSRSHQITRTNNLGSERFIEGIDKKRKKKQNRKKEESFTSKRDLIDVYKLLALLFNSTLDILLPDGGITIRVNLTVTRASKWFETADF